MDVGGPKVLNRIIPAHFYVCSRIREVLDSEGGPWPKQKLCAERHNLKRETGELYAIIKEDDGMLPIAKDIPVPGLGDDKGIVAAIATRAGRISSILVLGEVDD